MESLYRGDNPDQWINVVNTINNLHVNVYPTILTKSTNQAWDSVHADFPKIEHDSDLLIYGIKAFQWMKQETDNDNIEQSRIDTVSIPREEQSAMSVYNLTKGLMVIIECRIKIFKFYKNIQQLANELNNSEFNNAVLAMKITLKITPEHNKANIKSSILDKWKVYHDAKEKFENAVKIFDTLSEELAQLERVNYDVNFNKNEYINYFQFMIKFNISEQNYVEYIKTQEDIWQDTLKCLDTDTGTKIEPNSRDNNTTAKKLHKFTYQLEQYKLLCNETELKINECGLVELKMSLKEIESAKTSLHTYLSDIDIKVSEADKLYINSTRKIIKNIALKIEGLQNKQQKESEIRKAEASANIKSMESVRLTKLTGFEDYLSWQKSQKYLNTHTDKYKKAQALLCTLKCPEDQLRCQGIFDYDELMRIISAKYAHQDQIIPKLIDKLRKLPAGTNDDVMLSNIGIILNIYSQLKTVSQQAVEKFDSTVIDNMITKLTFATQKRYERYAIMNRSNNIEVIEEFIDDEQYSVISGGDRLNNVLPSDTSTTTAKRRTDFIKFISCEEQILHNMKARNDSLGAKPKKPTCRICKQMVCKCNTTKKKGGKEDSYKIETKEKACVVCGQEPHKNKFNKITSCLARCDKFRGISHEEKIKIIKAHKACYNCLVIGHTSAECRVQANCSICSTSRHHPLICPQANTNVEETHATNADQKTLLLTTEGVIINKATKACLKINILWDNGSTCNIIRHDTAKQLKIPSIDTTLDLSKVGEPHHLYKTKMYKIYLQNNNGETQEISAYEQPQSWENLTSKRIPVSQNTLNQIAKDLKINIRDINNVKGPIHMIVGSRNLKIHPRMEREYEDLVLYKTAFSSKPWVLGGTIHHETKESHVSAHIEAYKSDDFWNSDQLGLNNAPRCYTCIKAPACKACKTLTQPLSYQEQIEGELIRTNMKFDLKKGEIKVTYPFLKDVDRIFSDPQANKALAEKMCYNLRRSLTKDNLLDQYTDAWSDMLQRKAIREISNDEISKWTGPVNYVSHHAVLSQQKTTKCRPVCNSSLPNNKTTLNKMLAKGPSSLTNLLHVLLRFRSRPFVIIADLAKAYNTIKTGDKEMHLRRLLWWLPGDDFQSKPRTFGYIVLAFGDTPSACFLEYSKQEIARYMRVNLKEENLAHDFIAMSYVDDIAIAINTMKEAKIYSDKLPQGLEAYGFKIKPPIKIGEDKGSVPDRPSDAETMNLFGHSYCQATDEITLKFNVNFNKKRRGMKSGPNLSTNSDLTSLKITKRTFMSLLNSQYDPMGLASPFLCKFKIQLSKLFKSEYQWDDELSPSDTKMCLKMIKEIIFASEHKVKFRRANKPKGYTLKSLVCFTDASVDALCCVVYGLYKNTGSKVHSSLISAKTKICANTVPRNELQALVAGTRLVQNVMEALDLISETKEMEEICFFTDSTCTIDYLNQTNQKDIFIINRVCEIKRTMQKFNFPTKIYHVPSANNIADYGTRITTPFEFICSPLWQHGPQWIKNIGEEAELKITIDSNTDLQEVHHIESLESEKELDEIIEDLLTNKSNYSKVRNIIAYMMYFKNKNWNDCLEKSEIMIFKTQQNKNSKYMESFMGNNFTKILINGVYYAKGRETVNGPTLLKIVPKNTRLYNRISSEFHRKYHRGAVYTRANMLQAGYYLPAALQRLKKLKDNCPLCRKRERKSMMAIMGPLGNERMTPKLFHCVQGDISGPYQVKQFVNQRMASRKCWILVLIDEFSRYVILQLLEGLSKQNLLDAIECIFYRYGLIKEIRTDFGTQFVAARKELGGEGVMSDSELEKFGIELQSRGTKINLRVPKAPWIQGGVESMMKNLRKSMYGMKMSMNQFKWQTSLERMQFFINQRPVGLSTSLEVLTPNDISSAHSKILGVKNLEEFLAKADQNVEHFIQNWISHYWTDLRKQKKWFKSDEIKVGSIVAILDMKNDFSFPPLGIVEEVEQSSHDGENRYYKIRHKTRGKDNYQTTSAGLIDIGKGQTRVLRRPAAQLCMILSKDELNECNTDDFDIQDNKEISIDPQEDRYNKTEVINDLNDDMNQTRTVEDIETVPVISNNKKVAIKFFGGKPNIKDMMKPKQRVK